MSNGRMALMGNLTWKSAVVAGAGLLGVLFGVAFAGSQGKPVAKSQATAPANAAKATFAGGCFWCMEPPFENLPGVYSVISGYTGGQKTNPTYEEVGRGNTGHTEAVQIAYDPAVISYATLVEVFWRQINPTDGSGQFADRGSQYRPGIFYHNEEQKKLAEASRAALIQSGRFRQPIAIEITPFKAYYAAEEYHQDFYLKDPARYKGYRRGSGREGFLASIWGKEGEVKMIPVNQNNDGVEGMGMAPAGASKSGAIEAEMKATGAAKYRKPPEAELRKRLTPLQYKVTQESGTERAFTGEYWDNHKEGVYVDIVTGEPLFSSRDKFESGTGWPSFTRPLEKENVVEKTDRALGMSRTEVRSKHGDSHLGHVFNDGPAPTGMRYCLNSASLRFIPKENLAEEGYGEYLAQFAAR